MTPQSELANVYVKLEELKLGGENGIGDKLIPGAGPVPAPVMFIAEAPGAAEVRTGIPLVGPSGDAFNRLLELSGLVRNDVFITYAFKYKLPARAPIQRELIASRDCVSNEISLVNPRVIVAMGRTAIQMFHPGANVKDVRGGLKKSDSGKRWTLFTYDPKNLLHSDKDRLGRSLKSDFHKLRLWLEDNPD